MQAKHARAALLVICHRYTITVTITVTIVTINPVCSAKPEHSAIRKGEQRHQHQLAPAALPAPARRSPNLWSRLYPSRKNTTIASQSAGYWSSECWIIAGNNSTNESTKSSSAPTLSNTTFFAQPATYPESITSPESSKPPESTGSLDSSTPSGSTKNVSDKSNLSDQSRVDRIEKPQENLSPNLPPKLAGLNADKTNPVLGGIVQWTANATDPESDRIYYKFLEDGEDSE